MLAGVVNRRKGQVPTCLAKARRIPVVKYLLSVLVTALLLFSGARAQAQEAFVVEEYRGQIVVNPDSALRVQEVLTVDFGSNERHGIFRAIPTSYRTSSGTNRSIRVSDVVVRHNEHEVQADIQRDWGGELRIKIGDHDALVSGIQRYEIAYTVENAVNFFEDHAELYWNVTGNGWNTEIQTASVTVIGPDLSGGQSTAVGYQGVSGSSEAATGNVENTRATLTTTRTLQPGEGLTVVVGWPLGVVMPPSMATRVGWFIADNGILLLPLAVFTWLVWQFRRRGKDPAGKGTIVPEFAPPKGLSLLEQAALRTERIQGRDLVALLIDWAVDGYISIAEPKRKQYELTKQKALTGRSKEEQAFFGALFGAKSTITLSDQQAKLPQAAATLRGAIFAKLVEGGYLTKDPQTVRAVYIVVGVLVMAASVWLGMPLGLPWFIALMASGLLILCAAPFMPKRTSKGVTKKEEIEGFRLYLKTAERYRLKFAEQEKLFERYLPYAIVFGVATLWAKAFGDIAKAAPGWYSGYYGSHWSSVAFAQSIEGGLSSSMSAAMTTASSGGSGFSGGGSGGGFGGGGGGSW